MTLRIATQEDIPAVEKLRITAYQKATGSKILDNSFLYWDEIDDQSIVLILENEEKQIVSTLRGNMINRKIELEQFFDISLNSSFSFPVFTIGRAATFLEYRRLGYTAVMRILFLKACLNSKIQFIASTIQEDASRVVLLREMGYHIEEADISHRTNSGFHNTSTTLFNLLPKAYFLKALTTAKNKIVTPFSDFEISSDLIPTMKRKVEGFYLPNYAHVDLK
jgi:hypothetical protein